MLSAHPFLGKGRGRLAAQEISMAMAALGRSRHYRWMRIHPRHWRETALRCGLGAHIEAMLHDIVSRTATVLDDAARNLPDGFPASIADPILNGVRAASRRMENSLETIADRGLRVEDSRGQRDG